jgi:hypothetical protein
VIGISSATRERGHEDAVGELESAGGEWGKELHGVVEFWSDDGRAVKQALLPVL